jgi:hypothetical protein
MERIDNMHNLIRRRYPPLRTRRDGLKEMLSSFCVGQGSLSIESFSSAGSGDVLYVAKTLYFGHGESFGSN